MADSLFDLEPLDHRHWVRSSIAGGSFAEVGRLWHREGELVTTALAAGARQATKLDLVPLQDELWGAFRRHAEERGAAPERLRIKSADILNTYFPTQVGSFDLVACPGLLHLMPDPARALANLRLVTGRKALLSTMAVPERIENEAGRLDLSEAGALFAPALTPRASAVLSQHFIQLGIDFATLLPPGPGEWMREAGPNRGVWWWFMTPRHVDALATMAGFAIEARGTDWPGRSYCIALAR